MKFASGITPYSEAERTRDAQARQRAREREDRLRAMVAPAKALPPHIRRVWARMIGEPEDAA